MQYDHFYIVDLYLEVLLFIDCFQFLFILRFGFFSLFLCVFWFITYQPHENTVGIGQLNSSPMRRDYYRGSQDSLAVRGEIKSS